MTNCCPRPRMRWNGAIGAIARCKKVSTVCAPKSRSRHELRLICGEKPGARGGATLFTPYMRHGQDESNPVSLLQCRRLWHFESKNRSRAKGRFGRPRARYANKRRRATVIGDDQMFICDYTLTLTRRGAKLAVEAEKVADFEKLGLHPTYTRPDALAQATVVIDCTAEGLGLQHQRDWYAHLPHARGFIALSGVGF